MFVGCAGALDEDEGFSCSFCFLYGDRTKAPIVFYRCLEKLCPGICKALLHSRPPVIFVEENGGWWEGSGAGDEGPWF